MQDAHTESPILGLSQCHEDQYDVSAATNVLLDICLTFVILKCPQRRCM